jgi:cytochrome P450
MSEVTLEFILRAIFGTDLDRLTEKLGRNPFWLVASNPERNLSFASQFYQLRRLVADLARQRRESEAEHFDFLGMMLAARAKGTGAAMGERELVDEVMTLIIAGHETAASGLNSAWYLLSQHPAAEERLQAELQAVLGGRAPRHEDLAKLPYTRMVIEEAMRLYPPAHTLSRAAMGADEVLGKRIPKGATILIVPWLLHRNPKLWENPERFDPERFTPDRAARRHRFAYIPFGAGPRICIGAAFAMAEAMLILAALAQRYRLRLVSGFPVDPQGLITLRPRYGMRMTLERRS